MVLNQSVKNMEWLYMLQLDNIFCIPEKLNEKLKYYFKAKITDLQVFISLSCKVGGIKKNFIFYIKTI